jgi:hypothetical protein
MKKPVDTLSKVTCSVVIVMSILILFSSFFRSSIAPLPFLYLYFLLFIWSLAFLFIKIWTSPIIALIPAAAILLTMFFVYFLPFTRFYEQAFFTLRKAQLQETVQLYSEDKLEKYCYEEYLYIAPYRYTSHDGLIRAENENGVTKVMFVIYNRGLDKKLLMYTSNDEDTSFYIDPYMFGFIDIEKVEDHWYTAVCDFH